MTSDGARAIALHSAEAALALVVGTFGTGSAEAAEARRHVATMRRHAAGLVEGELERFFAAEGCLVDLERRARTKQGNGKAAFAPSGADALDVLAGHVLVRVATVAAQRVEWLWMHRLPLGKLCVLDGDPGLGKSTVTLDLAARLSAGRTLPDDERPREPAGVVLLTAEDDIADTIRPRLAVAGAALERVAVLTAVRDEQGRPRPPVLPDDVEHVRRAVREMRAQFVVVDPLMAFLNGKVDSHRDQDVRGALAQLAELAAYERAVVLVVRHLNKSQGGHPIYRGGGSIGIIGAARAGLLVAPDPKDDTRRVIAVSKSNLGPVPPSLAYRIEQAGDASRIGWEGFAESSASDLLAAQAVERQREGAVADAADWLRGLLADGPVAADDVKAAAKAAALSWRAIERARGQAGVRSHRIGFGPAGRWYLELEGKDRRPIPLGGLGGVCPPGGLCQNEGNSAPSEPPEGTSEHRPPTPDGDGLCPHSEEADPTCPRCGRDSCPGDCR